MDYFYCEREGERHTHTRKEKFENLDDLFPKGGICVCERERERDENLDHCLLKVVFIRERERVTNSVG